MELPDKVQRAVVSCITEITKQFNELVSDESMTKTDTLCALSLFISRVSASLIAELMKNNTPGVIDSDADVHVDKLHDVLLPYLSNFRDILVNEGHRVNLTAMVADDQRDGFDKLLSEIPWEDIAAGGYSN